MKNPKGSFWPNNLLKLFAFSFLTLTIFTNCSKNLNDNDIGGIPPDLPAADLVNFVNVSIYGVSDQNADNTLALQTAINTNEQIYIPAGTYIISKPLTKTSGRLIIKADNAIFKLSPIFPKTRSFSGALVLSNLNELKIDGLTIDEDRANLLAAGRNWRNFIMGMYVSSSSNVNINNCTVKNSSSISFSVHSSSNVTVSNCTSTNGMYHGVELDACTNVTIDKFRYIGIGNQGRNPAIGGIGILATVSNHLKITGCWIEDSPDTGTKTEGCNDVTWDGNTVKNSGKDGIKFMSHFDDGIHPAVVTVYNAKIINNVVDKIYNGRLDGSSEIQVWNAQDVTVSNNTVTGGIKTGYEAGIEIWATNGVTKNILVSNNTILNTNKFIYISNVSNIQIESNTCENTVDPISAANGFEAENSNSFTVTKNVFKRHGTTLINGVGVHFYNCADFSFTYNSVINAYGGIRATFTNSQTIDLSKNIWDNLGTYFASIGVDSARTVQNLLLNDNVISRVGTGTSLFKIYPLNLTLQHLNLTNTKIIGNGNNNRWAVEIPAGGNIAETDLTNFSSTGIAPYPQLAVLTGCKRIIGLKAFGPPKTGTWKFGDIVFNFTPSLGFSGWFCIVPGTPGVWKTIF